VILRGLTVVITSGSRVFIQSSAAAMVTVCSPRSSMKVTKFGSRYAASAIWCPSERRSRR
jgi:hypothetical protein